jgi:DNA-binding MarR family transcriptional regulator
MGPMDEHEEPGLRDVGPISSLIPNLAKAHRKLAGSLLHDLGLAAGQEFVLMLLWQESPRTQAELTRLLAVEPPTVAKTLARMERSGFIERIRSDSDRRMGLVAPTAAGRALEDSVTAAWAQLEEQTTSGLSLAEQDQLRSLLSRVAGTLADYPA